MRLSLSQKEPGSRCRPNAVSGEAGFPRTRPHAVYNNKVSLAIDGTVKLCDGVPIMNLLFFFHLFSIALSFGIPDNLQKNPNPRELSCTVSFWQIQLLWMRLRQRQARPAPFQYSVLVIKRQKRCFLWIK